MAVLRYVADRRTADEGAHTNAPILLHRSHITLVRMSKYHPKTIWPFPIKNNPEIHSKVILGLQLLKDYYLGEYFEFGIFESDIFLY